MTRSLTPLNTGTMDRRINELQKAIKDAIESRAEDEACKTDLEQLQKVTTQLIHLLTEKCELREQVSRLAQVRSQRGNLATSLEQIVNPSEVIGHLTQEELRASIAELQETAQDFEASLTNIEEALHETKDEISTLQSELEAAKC